MLQPFDKRLAGNYTDGNEAKLVSQKYNFSANECFIKLALSSSPASLGTCAFDGLLYVCGKIFNKIEFSTKSLFAFSIHQEDTTVQAVCRQLSATTR
jgi:hypothetical protein